MRTLLALVFPLLLLAANPTVDDLLHQSQNSMRTAPRPALPMHMPDQPASPKGVAIVAVVILMTASMMAVTSLLSEVRFAGRLPRRVRIRVTRNPMRAIPE